MNILEVIEGHEYKRIGPNTYRMLCPFHSDHSPSLTIYEDTNSYFCFTCQASGTAEYLYCKLNGIRWDDYRKEHGIELDFEKKIVDYRDQLNLRMSRVFFERLKKEPCGDVFRDMKSFDDKMASIENLGMDELDALLKSLEIPGKSCIYMV